MGGAQGHCWGKGGLGKNDVGRKNRGGWEEKGRLGWGRESRNKGVMEEFFCFIYLIGGSLNLEKCGSKEGKE